MALLGFGQVVLSRISWSSDPPINIAYNDNIDRRVLGRGSVLILQLE
jgi:hypothetical protein